MIKQGHKHSCREGRMPADNMSSLYGCRTLRSAPTWANINAVTTWIHSRNSQKSLSYVLAFIQQLSSTTAARIFLLLAKEWLAVLIDTETLVVCLVFKTGSSSAATFLLFNIHVNVC